MKKRPPREKKGFTVTCKWKNGKIKNTDIFRLMPFSMGENNYKKITFKHMYTNEIQYSCWCFLQCMNLHGRYLITKDFVLANSLYE